MEMLTFSYLILIKTANLYITDDSDKLIRIPAASSKAADIASLPDATIKMLEMRPPSNKHGFLLRFPVA